MTYLDRKGGFLVRLCTIHERPAKCATRPARSNNPSSLPHASRPVLPVSPLAHVANGHPVDFELGAPCGPPINAKNVFLNIPDLIKNLLGDSQHLKCTCDFHRAFELAYAAFRDFRKVEPVLE